MMNEQSDLRSIDTTELAAHIEKQDAFIIDVRSTSHGDMIYGSIRYEPKKLLEAEKLMLPLPKSSGLIILCDEDGKSERLETLAKKLAQNGYGEIATLTGGFAAWKETDGRMQERSMEQPIPDVTEHQTTR